MQPTVKTGTLAALILSGSLPLLFSALNPALYAQIDGGDYGVVNPEKSELEIIEEFTALLKILDIRGFEGGKTDCMQNKKTKQATLKAGRLLKKMISQLPAAYFIEVMGHADKRGHDYIKPGTKESINVYLARKRAESVAHYLNTRFNISTLRLRVGGAGDKYNERKVTFRIRKQP